MHEYFVRIRTLGNDANVLPWEMATYRRKDTIHNGTTLRVEKEIQSKFFLSTI